VKYHNDRRMVTMLWASNFLTTDQHTYEWPQDGCTQTAEHLYLFREITVFFHINVAAFCMSRVFVW